MPPRMDASSNDAARCRLNSSIGRKGEAAMAYVQGFVAAVPTANRENYRKHALKAASLFKDYGATRIVETWGDDVPDGKVTDFKQAVKAKPNEVVVFSWIEYPSKAVADAANEKMMKDPRMREIGEMPFDGQRMVFGGFATILDEAGKRKAG